MVILVLKEYILFNPGPVLMNEKVRKAQLGPDLCHREPEFVQLMTEVRVKLDKLSGGDHRFTTVTFGGSGTCALEATLFSVVNDDVLVISNGYYGEKCANILKLVNDLNVEVLKYQWGQPIDINNVEELLSKKPSIRFIVAVHHETSTGMLNPIHEIGEVAHKFGKIFVVDAISSIGIEDLDVTRDHIDFCIGSSNKCLASVPGISFVCAKKQKLIRLKGHRPRSTYLDLYTNYIYQEGKGSRYGPYFTMPVQAFYSLNVALDLLSHEGLEKRRQQTEKIANLIRDGLANLDLKFFIPREYMSNVLTVVLLPRSVSFSQLHNKLKERRIIIYHCIGRLSNKAFRIANIGSITEEHVQYFLESMENIKMK